jgi:hypothetical protein
MRLSHAAAVWMLERLGLDSALAGDLLEESARRRSTIWYWRQVLIAMWTGVWAAILGHKLLALRAVATGWAVNALWIFLWSKFLPIGLSSVPHISLESIATLLIILLTQVATGWVVARTHRAHAVPMVLVYAIWLVTSYAIGTFSEGQRLLVNSIDQPRFRAYLAWYLLPISIDVIGLLCGGVIAARRRRI